MGTPITHSQKTAATPCTVQAEILVPVAHSWPSRNRSSWVCLCLCSRLQDAGDKGLHRTSSFEKAQAQRCQGLSDSPLFQPDLSLPLTDGRMSWVESKPCWIVAPIGAEVPSRSWSSQLSKRSGAEMAWPDPDLTDPRLRGCVPADGHLLLRPLQTQAMPVLLAPTLIPLEVEETPAKYPDTN